MQIVTEANRASLTKRLDLGFRWAIYARYDGNGHARGDVISTHRTIEAADRKLSSMNRYSSFYALTDLDDAIHGDANYQAFLTQTA